MSYVEHKHDPSRGEWYPVGKNRHRRSCICGRSSGWRRDLWVVEKWLKDHIVSFSRVATSSVVTAAIAKGTSTDEIPF